MNIVHYALGFPSYRRGGMTKYCLDLMDEQIRVGNTVGMLWPGRIKKYGNDCIIETRKNVVLSNRCMCKSYEIINPLPVPLLDGIQNVKAFTQKKDKNSFRRFFIENNINVFHVHTLMGLPRECMEVAVELGINTIYTSHDYFGICPKVGLVRNGEICSDDHNCADCIECNKTALSLRKIQILQSPFYREIKDLAIIKFLRKQHNNTLYALNEEKNISRNDKGQLNNSLENGEYIRLRNYYISIFKLFFHLHFNSNNTKNVFDKYFDSRLIGKVISISHSSVDDNRKIKNFDSTVNIAYLGPITAHKGYYYLKDVLDDIYSNGIKDFKLHVYVESQDSCPYLVNHQPYKYDDLEKVMDNTDLLIVPSYETFGFTVLEALTYGVPVVVSKNVGAKDLINNGINGFVYSTRHELRDIINEIIKNPQDILGEINENIYNKFEVITLIKHAKKIKEIYNS